MAWSLAVYDGEGGYYEIPEGELERFRIGSDRVEEIERQYGDEVEAFMRNVDAGFLRRLRFGQTSESGTGYSSGGVSSTSGSTSSSSSPGGGSTTGTNLPFVFKLLG